MDNQEIIEKLPSSLFSKDALNTKKSYERGFYDGIHNCIVKLSQLEKSDTYGAYDDGATWFKFETDKQKM